MTRGIDLFRIYQTVTDWQAVKRAGIAFAWIKATNGTSVARDNSGNLAPADPTVAGARAAGIAPGLYHYALPGDPIRQADVFADEVIRLECLGPGTLPPALDLEEAGIGSTAQRRAFAVAFLRRLQARTGQARVAIYASASWMADLQPEAWGIDGLIIWTAAYGSNDGGRHGSAIASAGYRGRTDVHQYTSAGSAPGVQSEGLDVNESDIPLDQLLGGDDMPLTPLQDEMLRNLQFGEENKYALGRVGAAIANTDATVRALDAKLDQLAAKVDGISVGGGVVDLDVLVERVVDKLAARLAS